MSETATLAAMWKYRPIKNYAYFIFHFSRTYTPRIQFFDPRRPLKDISFILSFLHGGAVVVLFCHLPLYKISQISL